MEKMTKKIDLSGFIMKDQLNPKIWDGEKMKSEVRKTLMKIADDYFEGMELGSEVDIEDITMTGSLANYNWSKYSDIDLHILVDYKDVPVDEDLVLDFFKSKSTIWNDTHNIQIYGYDIELYVQDVSEKHVSTGVYSVLNDEWVTKPNQKEVVIDKKSIKTKSQDIMDKVGSLLDDLRTKKDYESIMDKAQKIVDKVKKMRKAGLDRTGEFSVENMVFKVLRRNGTLDVLYQIKDLAYDKSLTIENRGYLYKKI